MRDTGKPYPRSRRPVCPRCSPFSNTFNLSPYNGGRHHFIHYYCKACCAFVNIVLPSNSLHFCAFSYHSQLLDAILGNIMSLLTGKSCSTGASSLTIEKVVCILRCFTCSTSSFTFDQQRSALGSFSAQDIKCYD